MSLPQRVQKTIATPLVAAVLSLAALVPGVTSCAPAERADPAPRTIAVQPRVVMDGSVELHARGERIVIDEVLFHAPAVTLQEDGRLLGSVLEGDERGPLLFRYDVTSDGFGDVLGGERRWFLDPVVHGLSDLVFGFQPFQPDAATLDHLEAQTGVPLGALDGHTAAVHGYLLTSATSEATSSGFGNDCDGDPDGNPALCPAANAPHGERIDDRNDGDPDGNPSRPTGGTEGESDGDPDGNPSKPKTNGDVADGDPDGNPVKPSPVGDEPLDRDPDGNPARTEDDDGSAKSTGQSHDEPDAPRGASPPRGQQRVPFILVLNHELSLPVPVASLFNDELAPDEVLPIDLHVRIDELITEELLRSLDEEATDNELGLIVVEVPEIDCLAIDVPTHGVRRARREDLSPGGIRVSGGLR